MQREGNIGSKMGGAGKNEVSAADGCVYTDSSWRCGESTDSGMVTGHCGDSG